MDLWSWCETRRTPTTSVMLRAIFFFWKFLAEHISTHLFTSYKQFKFHRERESWVQHKGRQSLRGHIERETWRAVIAFRSANPQRNLVLWSWSMTFYGDYLWLCLFQKRLKHEQLYIFCLLKKEMSQHKSTGKRKNSTGEHRVVPTTNGMMRSRVVQANQPSR
jgi:hypothetical protein